MNNSQYFFNELIPDIEFFLTNQNERVINSNDSLDLFYKEYIDFVNDLDNRKSLSFSTEELKKTHLSNLNRESFGKISKLVNKYLMAINSKIDTIRPLLDNIQKANMNLELSRNLNQIRSLSNNKYSDTILESVESASDINRRLDTIFSTLNTLKDIKYIVTDPVIKEKNILGNVVNTILTNFKSNPSFTYVGEQFNISLTSNPVLPFTRTSAVHNYKSNISLEKAEYNNKSLYDIYNKLRNISTMIDNYFTNTFTDISFYDNDDSYFEKIVKSLKTTYFEKDNIGLEQSLPIRLIRLSTAINLITDSIVPTLYKDIKYIIEIFSKLGSHESINTSSESFKIPSIQKEVNTLIDVYKVDYKYGESNYNKMLRNLTLRTTNRFKSLNNIFKKDYPFPLYHCRKGNSKILPMCIDEFNQRLKFYEVVYLGAVKYLSPIINELNDYNSTDTINNIEEYLLNIVKDSKQNLFTTIKDNNHNLSASTSYLDTLENEAKVSLESMGYNQDNINELNINEYKDSINKLSQFLSGDLYPKIKNTFSFNHTKCRSLIRSLTLLAHLACHNKFEINFLNSLIDG